MQQYCVDLKNNVGNNINKVQNYFLNYLTYFANLYTCIKFQPDSMPILYRYSIGQTVCGNIVPI